MGSIPLRCLRGTTTWSVLAAVEKAGVARPAAVHKRRTRASVMGCMAEVAAVPAEGRFTRTIAIEAEDPAAVIAAVRELHLDGFVQHELPEGTPRVDRGPASPGSP